MKLKVIFKIEDGMKTERLRAAISSGGLKSTKQRDEIFSVFLSSSGHRNVGEIYARVARVNPKIGYTTVYRTLKLFARLGLAEERKFADGETRYEPVARGGHHDHLICLECGKIIEFEDAAIESLQDRVAGRYHFKTFNHRMELYGRCAACEAKSKAPKEKK